MLPVGMGERNGAGRENNMCTNERLRTSEELRTRGRREGAKGERGGCGMAWRAACSAVALRQSARGAALPSQ